jgi:acyl carrier protein
VKRDNVRQFVIEALEHAGVFSIRDEKIRTAFLNGTSEVNFKTLEMDSLARMELCIYIELNAGIELTPDQLEEIKTLECLARILAVR